MQNTRGFSFSFFTCLFVKNGFLIPRELNLHKYFGYCRNSCVFIRTLVLYCSLKGAIQATTLVHPDLQCIIKDTSSKGKEVSVKPCDVLSQ